MTDQSLSVKMAWHEDCRRDPPGGGQVPVGAVQGQIPSPPPLWRVRQGSSRVYRKKIYMILAGVEGVESSWPMLERCFRRQWQGLTSEERFFVTAEWDRGHVPVSLTSPGHALHVIWKIEHGGGAEPRDHLMSIKVDAWPS